MRGVLIFSKEFQSDPISFVCVAYHCDYDSGCLSLRSVGLEHAPNLLQLKVDGSTGTRDLQEACVLALFACYCKLGIQRCLFWLRGLAVHGLVVLLQEQLEKAHLQQLKWPAINNQSTLQVCMVEPQDLSKGILLF